MKTKKTNTGKKLICFVLSLVCAFSVIMPYYSPLASADETLEDLESKYEEIENRIEQNEKELANVQSNIKTNENKLEDLESQIGDINEQIDLLDEKVKESAEYRLKYPETSLLELSKIISNETGVNVSKSCLNHRFRKIKEFALKISEQ